MFKMFLIAAKSLADTELHSQHSSINIGALGTFFLQ